MIIVHPFIKAVGDAIKRAKEEDVLMYVRETPNAYHVTSTYEKDWLFKAYPGGRKILSKSGNKLYQRIKSETPNEVI